MLGPARPTTPRFRINGSQLQTAAIFNYNTQNSYSVRIRVTDENNQSTDQVFTITVQHSPTAVALSGTTVGEFHPIGTVVGSLTTTESGSGHTYTYTLVSGTGSTDNGSFTVNGSQLQTNAVFNYNTQNSYSIRVRVTDENGQTFDQVFTITVQHSPTAVALSGTTVAEFHPIGTVVGTLSTTETGSGHTYTYALVAGTGSTDNGSFSVNGSQLQTNAVFNYNTQNSYSVRVRVTDENGQTFDQVFTITVQHSPTAITLSANTVHEYRAVGTQVGTLTTTESGSGHTYTYTLVSGVGATDNGSFTLNGTQLLTNAVFNYNTQSSYSIRVRVTDENGQTVDQVLTIQVVQNTATVTLSSNTVQEFRPLNALLGNLSTTETGTGHTYTYALVSGAGATDNGSFTLRGTQLFTNAIFDSTVQSSYSIRVRVTDENGQPFDQILTITVVHDPALARTGTTLTVTGTSGNDTFSYNGSSTSSFTLNGVTYATGNNISAVVFNGNGGTDVATLTGSGIFTAVLGAGTGYVTGTGYTVTVNSVGSIYATGNASDYAYLSGTTNNTTFVGTSTYSYVMGSGFMDQVAGLRCCECLWWCGWHRQQCLLGRSQRQ